MEARGPQVNEIQHALSEVSVVGRTAFMVAAERAIETDRGKDARRPSFAVHCIF